MAVPTSDQDSQLVESLLKLSKKDPKLVRSSEYDAPADPTIKIRSWRMSEFKYYLVPSPFPTLARGLFTQRIHDSAGKEEEFDSGMYKIVVRGYDKFFNIGEVPWTNWAAIETHTSPPYDLTLKSNGCIIFIGAISPSKLIVTSKHSLGPIQNVEASHAQMGERWLLKHLERKNKTTEQLAQVLWNNKWTAVAELCDDSFEEHVLPYPAEKTGLHLHGINNSSGVFNTRPPQEVSAFAQEWGFIETPSHVVHSVSEVKEFTDAVSKTGAWNGEPVEGFVVRCHVSDAPPSDAKTAPPYPPGSSFFFKVKFDEPYMMYRDWREITKMLLSAKDPQTASLPKAKLNRPESRLYKDWVQAEIIKDKAQFDGYSKGRGIIATRERFLNWMQGEKDPQKLAQQETVNQNTPNGAVKHEGKRFGKTIIVPVGIPGCGKTTISIALQHLFNFGHTQSDDVRQKKAAPVFIQNVLKELKTHDVVIADKNNHLQQHRQSLRDAVRNMYPPVRLLAFNWALDKPPAMIHRVCADRIFDRGDNHQTLRADAVAKSHEEVLWMFINSTEGLGENEVDEIVEMDLEDGLEDMFDQAVAACVRTLGLEKPSAEQVAEALTFARQYKIKAEAKDEKRKPSPVRYFGFLPEINVNEVIEARLAQGNVPEAVEEFWTALKADNRITPRPHITIVHSKNLPQDQALWDRCQSLFMHVTPPTFSFKLGHLVYDGRVMALTVEGVEVDTDPGQDTSKEALEFLSELDDGLKKRLHITVGTRSSGISPIEAMVLVNSWKNNQAGAHVGSIDVGGMVVKGRIKGLKA